MTGPPISTHVLDATAGVPAAGVQVTLERRDAGGTWRHVASGATGADGRLRFDSSTADWERQPAGEWRLTFGSGEYFGRRGTATFYPEVTVAFSMAAGHCHVPLLLSPFAYSTYRGS